MPGLTTARGMMMAEAAAVCLESGQLVSGCIVSVSGIQPGAQTLEWDPVTPQQIASYADLQEATEHGAYGLAILHLATAEGLTVLERSRKGPGFDYWLAPEDDDEDALPFQNAIRLEVSGILIGAESDVRARARIKVAQVAPSNNLAPARIVIVEFSQPHIRVEAA